MWIQLADISVIPLWLLEAARELDIAIAMNCVNTRTSCRNTFTMSLWKKNNIQLYISGICKDKTLDAISVTVKILFVTHGGRLKGWLWKIVSSYRGSVRSKHQNNLLGIYKNVPSSKVWAGNKFLSKDKTLRLLEFSHALNKEPCWT